MKILLKKMAYMITLPLIGGLIFIQGAVAEDDGANQNDSVSVISSEEIFFDREQAIAEISATIGSQMEDLSQLVGVLKNADDEQLEAARTATTLEQLNSIIVGDSSSDELDGVLTIGDFSKEYSFTPVTPCRIIDTRNAGGAFASGVAREYYVYGAGGAMTAQGGNPAGCSSPIGEPTGVMINITAVPVSGGGNFTVYPSNVSAPSASIINYKAGVQNIANATGVKTYFSMGKEIELKNNYGTAHLVVDVLGYYNVPHVYAGVEYASNLPTQNLSPTDKTVETLVVTTPASGHCVVTATGYFKVVAGTYIRCTLGTGTSVITSDMVDSYFSSGNSGYLLSPVAITKGFSKPSGTTTYRLVCDALGTSNQANDINMTASCAKNKY